MGASRLSDAVATAAEAFGRGEPCVVRMDAADLEAGSRRPQLVAALPAYVDRLVVPDANAAALAVDLGLPAGMIDIEDGDAAPSPIAVRWTGDHETATSLATINRAVCARLAGRPGLRLQRQELDGERLDPPLGRAPSLEVRHRWPPDFEVPPVGRLALIQPWEFGAIPTAWETPLREGVDELWVPSEYVRRMYLAGGMAPERVHVVPNGVDLDVFRPDGPRRELDLPEGTRFLFVGGTIVRKGVDVLVAAYAEAFAGHPDVTLVVKDVSPGKHYRGRNAGEGLRAFADDPESPRLVYLDDDLDTAELAALYRACDVLVHPYRGEGFAMPVLEAMACGLPVIVTAGGPTDEFVPDAACWRVASTRSFPPQSLLNGMPTSTPIWMLEPDAVHLARLLLDADADADGRRARGGAAHAAAQRYGWDAIADAYAKRIAALAARPPRTVEQPESPLELPVARAVNLLATPAWRGHDALADLFAAWAAAFGPDDDAALFLLVDPDRDGAPEAWEARVLQAAATAGVDLEALADVTLLDHRGAAGLARLHAAFDAYVPLHAACAGHQRLARAAGSAVVQPAAGELAVVVRAAAHPRAA